MDHDPSQHEHSPGNRAFPWVLCGFILIAAFFLLGEHRAHALGFLPYALLLACPLLHVFMHRGHGDHSGHRDQPGHAHDEKDRP